MKLATKITIIEYLEEGAAGIAFVGLIGIIAYSLGLI